MRESIVNYIVHQKCSLGKEAGYAFGGFSNPRSQRGFLPVPYTAQKPGKLAEEEGNIRRGDFSSEPVR